MTDSNSLEREESVVLIKELFANKNRSEKENDELSALIEEINFTPARESSEKYIAPIKYFFSPEMIQIYTDLVNKGDGDVAYLLGKFYFFLGSEEIGFEWFEKGSELNKMGCLYVLGISMMNKDSQKQFCILNAY